MKVPKVQMNFLKINLFILICIFSFFLVVLMFALFFANHFFALSLNNILYFYLQVYYTIFQPVL